MVLVDVKTDREPFFPADSQPQSSLSSQVVVVVVTVAREEDICRSQVWF